MIPITEFRGREVAVFGLGRTGLPAVRALMAGGAIVRAWDDTEASRLAALEAGIPVDDINRRDWRQFACLVLSPGVPLRFPKPHRVVELAEMVGVPILSDIELFARAVNALPEAQRPKLIGITGTNGKSTTTALIGHILAACGRDVRVGGNIGYGVLGLEPLHPGAIYVLELSSYQLDLVDQLRLNAAILLNITPDHLARHGGMEGYIEAKKRIFRNQTGKDWAIVGTDDPVTRSICGTLPAEGNGFVCPVSNQSALGRGISVVGGKLYESFRGRSSLVMNMVEAEALPGRHNWQNAAAAYAAARALGLAPRDIAQAIANFPGLAHRLELAGRLGKTIFINDSKATNADAAEQALKTFTGVRWILGGEPKEGGIASLVPLFPGVVKAYLIGEAAPEFHALLTSRGVDAALCGDVENATRAALADAQSSARASEIILFSPACASFDQFRDFEHRGDVFKAIVGDILAAAAEPPDGLRAVAGERG